MSSSKSRQKTLLLKCFSSTHAPLCTTEPGNGASPTSAPHTPAASAGTAPSPPHPSLRSAHPQTPPPGPCSLHGDTSSSCLGAGTARLPPSPVPPSPLPPAQDGRCLGEAPAERGECAAARLPPAPRSPPPPPHPLPVPSQVPAAGRRLQGRPQLLAHRQLSLGKRRAHPAGPPPRARCPGCEQPPPMVFCPLRRLPAGPSGHTARPVLQRHGRGPRGVQGAEPG